MDLINQINNSLYTLTDDISGVKKVIKDIKSDSPKFDSVSLALESGLTIQILKDHSELYLVRLAQTDSLITHLIHDLKNIHNKLQLEKNDALIIKSQLDNFKYKETTQLNKVTLESFSNFMMAIKFRNPTKEEWLKFVSYYTATTSKINKNILMYNWINKNM